MMLTSKETLLPLFAALLLVGFSISSRRHFTRFLERSSARWGKSPRSLLADAAHGLLVDTGGPPLPVLWMTLGYGLQSARRSRWRWRLAMESPRRCLCCGW